MFKYINGAWAFLLPSLAASPPNIAHAQAMATFNATTVVVAVAKLPPRAQLRVGRAESPRCRYSKEGMKACSARNLSRAVLYGKGLRRSLRPWGPGLVEERLDT
jgi:hypothetical protein